MLMVNEKVDRGELAWNSWQRTLENQHVNHHMLDQQQVESEGVFGLCQNSILLAPARFALQKGQFLERLTSEFGLVLKKAGGKVFGIIVLSYERRLEATLTNRGYTLLVKTGSVVIASSGTAGIAYGIQHLFGLIQRTKEELLISCQKITQIPPEPGS